MFVRQGLCRNSSIRTCSKLIVSPWYKSLIVSRCYRITLPKLTLFFVILVTAFSMNKIRPSRFEVSKKVSMDSMKLGTTEIYKESSSYMSQRVSGDK